MELETDELNEKLNELSPVDPIGDEAYAARYEQRTLLKWLCLGLGVLLTVSVGANALLSLRKPIVRYIRIDSVGHAQAIAYNDLDYTPREGEVRRDLEDWVKARYIRLQATVQKTYKTNYYFVDAPLASRKMQEDLESREIAKIASGQLPENDIAINSIQFLSLAHRSVHGSVLMSGQAIVDFFKLYAASNAQPARKEHWLVSVTFYLNPQEVAAKAQDDPQYETLNPLGLVITDFHETRVMN